MTLTLDLTDAAVVYDLNFDPEFPCESSHEMDPTPPGSDHPAERAVYWSCGCMLVMCRRAELVDREWLDYSLRRTLHCPHCGGHGRILNSIPLKLH